MKSLEKAHRELISEKSIHVTLSLGNIVILPNSKGEIWNPKELPNGEFDENQGYIVVGQSYSYFDGVYVQEFQMEFPEDEAPVVVTDEKGEPKPLYKTMVIPMSISQFNAGKYKAYKRYLPFPAQIVSRLTFNKELSNRQLQNSKYVYFKDGKPIYEIKQIVPYITIVQFNKINGTFLETPPATPPSPSGVSTNDALKSLGLEVSTPEKE